MMGFASLLATPLQPADYLGLINPFWSTREVLGRVESVRAETSDSATVLIRPGWGWPEHRAGQFLGLGIEIDGVRHWRSYSMSEAPRADRRLAVTVKAQPAGLVSNHLVHGIRPGAVLALAGPFGSFVLPDSIPDRLLFLTAGSGVTPVLAILQELAARPTGADLVMIHSARNADDVIRGPYLRSLTGPPMNLRLHERYSRIADPRGRFRVAELSELCPDWQKRSTWACGPAGLLDDVERHWQTAGCDDRLQVERFGLRRGASAGGQVHFIGSDRRVEVADDTPLAQVAAGAGVAVPAGCRIGMCGSCVAPLRSGRVRDLQGGGTAAAHGQLIRTCVHAAVGPVEIDL